jgi:hypothetical protein
MTIKKMKPILDAQGRPSKEWIQAMSKLQQWRTVPYVKRENKNRDGKA